MHQSPAPVYAVFIPLRRAFTYPCIAIMREFPAQTRPDPDQLLAGLARARARGANDGTDVESASRGRLKIFFGMAPGVGKTYAMLAAAQRLAATGVDVVAGIVETHGRSETEQLLLGLDIVPRKKIEHRPGGVADAPSVTLEEFDVDAAIARRPDILLVDELAHTNAPGSTRQKRWQDVQECLKAGLHVYTTLNVQHLESLNDVVTQITGVAVRETVPDSIFDEADELELVDLPPEVLHERLKAGKVYLAENASRAVDPTDGFFRKGNLTALRELALRRTAGWVDSELRRYKQDRGIRAVWPAGERILVAVSPSPMSPTLLRSAKRMAAGLHAELLAVYVETRRTATMRPSDRDRLTQTLRLAESLGASTTTITAENAARDLIAFARSRNVSRIVVGKTGQPRWREAIFGNFVNNLIRESGDIDIHVIRGDAAASLAPDVAVPASPPARSTSHREAIRIAISLGMVGLVTILGHVVFASLDLTNVAMVYLAAVVVAAVWLGRVPAVVGAVTGVAAFDFFFVPPRMTFAVSDAQYLVTFGVMLAVGLLIAQLTARLRSFAGSSQDRERRTAALYAMSRAMSSAQDAREVAAVGARHVRDTLQCDAIVSASTRHATGSTADVGSLDLLAASGSPDWFDERERGVAGWCFDNLKPAGAGTDKLPSASGRHVPIVGSSGKIGVLSVRPHATVSMHDTASLLILDMLTNQIASAMERVTLIESQQTSRIEAERERLRNALLRSVSHDLRTPLASITGAASTLEQSDVPIDDGTRASLLRTIVSESDRLNDIIANLVFATRLESGAVSLRREWTTAEEIVGVGISRHRAELGHRPFRITLPQDLPLIRVDNAMLPQVVHNLVENALRYTPPGTPISITAWTTPEQLIIRVSDEGPGLAEDEASRVFQRFYRGRAAKGGTSNASSTGMGLGLTICDGIVGAHGGRIWAEANVPRGVSFFFSIPLDVPQPSMPPDVGGEDDQ
jgi:two-component system, OmpR family, sensor histidine kinase KdpD